MCVYMRRASCAAGAVRRVEMPPQLGFKTSNWAPAPATFEGKQRMEVRTRRGGRGMVVGSEILQNAHDGVFVAHRATGSC